MKLIIKLLIYGSIIALLYYLYNIDFIAFQNIKLNYLYFSISVILLILGFVFSAISWKVALSLHGISISNRKAIVSHGLPVFTKYIPGRVWTIIGRAGLVKNNTLSMKKLSFISLKEQLVYLCLGFIISIYPILKTDKINNYAWIIISFTFLLFIVLISSNIQKYLEGIWNRIFGKKINIPRISIKEFLKLTVSISIYWILWIAGFYFLLISVYDFVPVYYALAFPLSICIGLVSVIFPGGIGVREGIISLFLLTNGLSPEMAISFSIFARIWFLIGEIFIFLISFLLKIKD